MHPHFPNVPYRPLCGPSIFSLGDCYQHRQGSGAVVTQYVNTTRVTDYAGNPDGRPPYESPLQGGLPDCAGDPDCGDGLPRCNGWIVSGEVADLLPCFGTQVDSNCYGKSGTIDFNTCRKLGFKNVRARKSWHGGFGFMHEGCTIPLVSGCNYCDYEPPRPDVDQTKYLTKTANGSMTQVVTLTADGSPVSNYDGFLHRTGAVGRYDGNQTISCNEGGDGKAQLETVMSAVDTSYPCNLYWKWVDYLNLANASAAGVGEIIEDTHTARAGSFTWTHGFVTFSSSFDLDAGTFEGSYLNSNPSTYYSQYESVSLSNTSVNYHSSLSYISSVYSISDSIDMALGLGNPYTSAEVVSDVNGLLEKWNLADDIIYPWRTDEYGTIAPLVSYNEMPIAVGPSLGLDCTGDYSSYYDGSILGAPLPTGFQNFFEWRHENWAACFSLLSNSYGYYVESVGRWASSDPVPLSATQWTNYRDGWDFAPCAWYSFNGGVLQGQKWAEIQIGKPSYNFARPCGQDRYNLEEPTVRCVTSTGDGSTLTIDNYNLGATSIASNDSVLVCGLGTGLDGGWTVSKIDDDNYQLTAQLFSFPSGYVSPYDCENGILGKLRFPNAPAICGRVKIVGASSGAPITIGFSEDTWLRDGDKVYVQGCSGNTAANGLWAVGVKDPRTVILSGTSGNAPYRGGGFASVVNGADERWNDTEPKGDYSVLTFDFNRRDVGEFQRLSGRFVVCNLCDGCDCGEVSMPAEPRPYQATWGLSQDVSSVTCTEACLPHKPCCPSVIAISPNGESWTNGRTHGFPSNFVCDERYSSYWQSYVRQQMPDLLWEKPHKPCAGVFSSEDTHTQGGLWNEDDGTCQEDTVDPDVGFTSKFYPMRPWVEARCSLPDGSPNLPHGVYIGCLSVAQLNTPTQPQGNICLPLDTVDHVNGSARPNSRPTPWGRYLRELGCVCAERRFHTEYEADGVSCKGEAPPP